jgi:hypothetical protein
VLHSKYHMQALHPTMNYAQPTINELIHNRPNTWYRNMYLVSSAHLTSVTNG